MHVLYSRTPEQNTRAELCVWSLPQLRFLLLEEGELYSPRSPFPVGGWTPFDAGASGCDAMSQCSQSEGVSLPRSR